MFQKISIALLIFSLLLAGCSPASRDFSPSDQVGVVTEMLQVEAPASAPMAEGEKGSYALDQTAASTDRLVIKNGTLSMAVDDPLISRDNIAHMAEAMGGFVVSADMYQQTLSNGIQVPQVSMTIRVPSERLDEALKTIKAETDQPIITENLNQPGCDRRIHRPELAAGQLTSRRTAAAADHGRRQSDRRCAGGIFTAGICPRTDRADQRSDEVLRTVSRPFFHQHSADRQRRHAATLDCWLAAGWSGQASPAITHQSITVIDQLCDPPGHLIPPGSNSRLWTHHIDRLGNYQPGEEKAKVQESPATRTTGISLQSQCYELSMTSTWTAHLLYFM